MFRTSISLVVGADRQQKLYRYKSRKSLKTEKNTVKNNNELVWYFSACLITSLQPFILYQLHGIVLPYLLVNIETFLTIDWCTIRRLFCEPMIRVFIYALQDFNQDTLTSFDKFNTKLKCTQNFNTTTG